MKFKRDEELAAQARPIILIAYLFSSAIKNALERQADKIVGVNI